MTGAGARISGIDFQFACRLSVFEQASRGRESAGVRAADRRVADGRVADGRVADGRVADGSPRVCVF
ncbi:hypothetical protein LBMAG46_37580 [Planctomycetia bacterium]|nr:hypothetical protein LBMAG46_37580 [Planctomycetia bacterium]